jgi:2-hydroxychromene-2-carboxylate isomerase
MPAPLTVYIDFKSPYAFLAIEPTRHLAQALGIEVDWRPFVLDIPSYLGSAQLDRSGRVASQSRSDNQWSKVKYAYYDCRRYANLRGLTLRGTEKIWDTSLAAIGMLWAKARGDDILKRYIDAIYQPFWRRELDVEDCAVIQRVLLDVGADVEGFEGFAVGAGAAENDLFQARAFDAGIFGVPTYVVGSERFFGREHLPRIRWLLEGGRGPAPDIACELLPNSRVEQAQTRTLDIGICREDPESLLALPRILALREALDIALRWFELPSRKRGGTPAPDDNSRGARHRRYRTMNRERDWQRYGAPRPEQVPMAIDETLTKAGIHLAEGGAIDSWAGMASMAGYVGSPVFRIGEETFVGRQHLPLIQARFA